MRRHLISFAITLLPCFLGAQSYRKLPDWAIPVYEASRNAPKPPVDSGAWVLLDRTEFAYTGDGELVTHHFRLVEVLTEKGFRESTYTLSGLGGRAGKVKTVKGWNLRPDGELVKLDSDHVVTVERAGDSGGITNQRLTGAVLNRVVRGSLIAFEAVQVNAHPVGPAEDSEVLEGNPVFRWEVLAATREGWFTNLKKVSLRLEARHFRPWIPTPRIVQGSSITAENLPALPMQEAAVPNGWNALPRIELTFIDPDLKDAPTHDTWDDIAVWEEAKFYDLAVPTKLPGVEPVKGLEGLKAIHSWMRTNLIYKAIYLTPERSWLPLPPEQVVRRRYGDCKDLTACFIAAARAAGYEAFPVLARIKEGRIEEDQPVYRFCFNHVIAAVRLESSLGLPSEVETHDGRFLLVDLTARSTPIGLLPTPHMRGRLLICAGRKGIWVQVPEAAIDLPRIEATLAAEVEPSGRLLGTMKIYENGNARDLRIGAMELDPLAFQRFVSSNFLNLPPNAHAQVIRHSDPMDLDHPFEVELQMDHPRGFNHQGEEWELDGLGIFRMVPQSIQRAGQPRQYPVEYDDLEQLNIHAEIRSPFSLVPGLPSREVSTAFVDAEWSAQAKSDKAGESQLLIHFRRDHKFASFGFETRELGVSEWNKGRRLMQSMADDALIFKHEEGR